MKTCKQNSMRVKDQNTALFTNLRNNKKGDYRPTKVNDLRNLYQSRRKTEANASNKCDVCKWNHKL